MHHPPFPLWEWGNDLLWVFCMLSCFVLSWRTKAGGIRWLRYGSLTCVVLRIPFGDFGGLAFLLEMPLCLWLAAIAIQYLVRPGEMKAEPANPSHSEPAARPTEG